jgi:phenylalanyl-tRNA synthetase beta chain
MKFTLGWLRDHLQTDATLGRITDTLTRLGLELEAVTDPGAALAPFVVARVIEAVQHPNADRLRVCRVDTGSGIVTVVCGAPNARTGMMAVFAPPGSTIPGTGAVLKTGEIRGVASAGMLLSRREMGLGEEHEGIVELQAEAKVGVPYPEFAGIGDPVIEIAVTPNRGDALGVRGIARDLAAAGLGTLVPWRAPEVAEQGESPIQWRGAWPEACPYVLGRAVRGVRNGPSPGWMARRLTAIGLRPISALVDITNYMAIDLGRPLHVFDAGKVVGDLVVRRGEGETFRALDGRDYTVTGEDCVIADDNGVQSLGGVIGGAATGCDEATTDVFIECALFDPVRIALTGRRHQIGTDARQRFERGVDQAFLPEALDAATGLIVALCGGTPSGRTQAGAEPDWRRTARLGFGRLAALSGAEIPPGEAVAALTALGFGVVAEDAESVTVAVPSWRNDIAGRLALRQAPELAPERLRDAAASCAAMEQQADLIEEILRLRGLDSIAPVSLPRDAAVPAATLTGKQTRAALARRVLATRGLLECVTFSFTDSATVGLFGAADAPTVANPIAADLDRLRPTPLATLALAAARNAARGFRDVALFELGPAFTADVARGQHRRAAALRAGETPRHWGEAARALDAFDAKADALAVLAALQVPPESVTATADAPSYYHPGRGGTLRQGPKLPLAYFGALHPALCAALDLPASCVAMEILLDAIPEPKRRRKPALDLPAMMPVRRDYAFVAPLSVSADAVLRAARSAERALITGGLIFDVYPLPDGRKSLAIELTLQPTDHTLTDAELEAVSAKIVAAVTKATGATLR